MPFGRSSSRTTNLPLPHLHFCVSTQLHPKPPKAPNCNLHTTSSEVGQGPIHGPCPAILHKSGPTAPRGVGLLGTRSYCWQASGVPRPRGCAGEPRAALPCPHLSYCLSGTHQAPRASGVLHTVPLTHPPTTHLLPGPQGGDGR